MLNVKVNPASDDLLIDGEICFSADTCKYSIYYKGKYYPVPEQAIELSNLIKNKGKRKTQYYEDVDKVWQYYQPKTVCVCGCNVYHFEYDGKKIYSICNACGEIVGVVRNEHIEELLSKGIWK